MIEFELAKALETSNLPALIPAGVMMGTTFGFGVSIGGTSILTVV